MYELWIKLHRQVEDDLSFYIYFFQIYQSLGSGVTPWCLVAMQIPIQICMATGKHNPTKYIHLWWRREQTTRKKVITRVLGLTYAPCMYHIHQHVGWFLAMSWQPVGGTIPVWAYYCIGNALGRKEGGTYLPVDGGLSPYLILHLFSNLSLPSPILASSFSYSQ